MSVLKIGKKMDKNKTDEYALKEFIKAFPTLLKNKKIQKL